MVKSAFKRAVADVSTQSKKGGGGGVVSTKAAHDLDLDGDRIVLTDDITAIRMHHLAITLRPLAGGSAGRPMLTASRWEIRKAVMSLCCTPPTMFDVGGRFFVTFCARPKYFLPLQVVQLWSHLTSFITVGYAKEDPGWCSLPSHRYLRSIQC